MFKVTADFLKALRSAKEVFVHSKGGNTATIRLQKRKDWIIEHKTDWTKEYTIVCGEWYSFPYFGFNTMYIVGSNWDMFRKVLRVGDELRFQPRTNNNQYLETCTARSIDDNGRTREEYKGMNHDQLTVSVYRKDKLYLEDAVVEDSVCPSNSARSIGRYR